MTRLLLALVVASSCLLRLSADERPNVILILADDLAIGDLAAVNGGISRTPQLDVLATQSVCFDQAYSGSCVCAPARAALMTGRYPHRTGVVTLNMNRFPALTSLKRDEVTIADQFRSAGYTTALVGKWHLGLGKDYHPLQRGFDEFEGFSGSEDLGYFRYGLDVGGVKQEAKDGRYLTEDLSRRAIEFVRRNRDRPFFLHLAHYAPHRPLEAPADRIAFFRNKGLDANTATIYAMIEIMDHGIGQLLRELEQQGIAEKTIVVFSSDNGPDPIPGTRFNASLRGTKYQVSEGGIRVPFFVRWSGTLMPGKRSQPVHFIDVMPTLLELCGIRPTPSPAVDGCSFAALLRDAANPWTFDRYWQWNRGVPNYTHNAAFRSGRWKLVRPFVSRGLRITDSNEAMRLFDLEKDPSEQQDVAYEYPDRVEDLARKLDAWCDSVERDRERTSED